MISPRLPLAALSAFALAGCQYMPWHKPKVETPALTEEAETVIVIVEEDVVIVESAPETCDVLESRDWAAWVNLMPGPDATPTIHVTGKVDVRTGGYTFDCRVSAVTVKYQAGKEAIDARVRGEL